MFALVVMIAVVGGACGRNEGAKDPEGTGRPVPASAGTAEPAGLAAVDDILLITVDTLRADVLGFAGGTLVSTPNLDKMAAGGRVFPTAHAHNVVTLPSHANILTGLHPYEHGIRDNSGFRLPEAIPTLATRLSAEGFATAAVVGAFPLDARFGLQRGFDLYDDQVPEGSHSTDFDYPERRGDEVVSRGLAWWRANAGRRRFLWLHLFDPHAPYDPPEPHAARYAQEPYLGEVAAVDDFLGPILDEVGGATSSRAVVIFTADHGESLGEHGELTHGLFAYEATLRVPLVVWAHGLPAGRDTRSARHIDIVPTALAALGLDPAEELPGRSLLDSAGASSESYFEALSATLDRGWAPLRGVLREGTKFISLPLPELYSLDTDPDESLNLVDRERQLARTLADELPAESVWPPERGAVTSEEREALRSLGYLAGSARSRESYGVEDDPKNLVALDHKMQNALGLYREGSFEEAARLAREVIDARPDMSVGYYHLGQILLEAGELAPAIEVLGEAYTRGVASDELIRQLALSLAQVGRAGEGVELLRPLAASGEPDLLNALGVVLSEAGMQDEARSTLNRVFETDPRNPPARENLALVALRLEDWAEAERQARQALALNDRLGMAWNYLGAALYNVGRPREALEAWESALSWEPDLYDVYYNIAMVASEVGNRDQARRALERFVANAPPERYAADIEQARQMLRQMGG